MMSTLPHATVLLNGRPNSGEREGFAFAVCSFSQSFIYKVNFLYNHTILFETTFPSPFIHSVYLS